LNFQNREENSLAVTKNKSMASTSVGMDADHVSSTILARLGVDIRADESLFQRCLTVCAALELTPDQLANEFDAFSVNSGSADMALSLDSLEKLRVFVMKRRERAGPSTPQHSSQHGHVSPHLDFLKRPTPPSASPQGTALKVPRMGGADMSPASTQSPVVIGAAYATRKNAGEQLVSYKPELGPRGPWSPSTAPGRLRCVVTCEDSVGVQGRYRSMYTPMIERAGALEKLTLSMQEEMLAAHPNSFLSEITPTCVPRQEAVTVVGRICCEAGEGRINRTSVMLEGSKRDSGGRRIHMDLRSLPQFALFPGQVVACHGVNASGTRLVAQDLVAGVPRPLPRTEPSRLMEFQHSTVGAGGRALSILVASGPFTTSADLEYAPLNDLLAVILTLKPDVAILLGPFVDENHPQVAAGLAGAHSGDGTFALLDFETLFKLRISTKLADMFEGAPDLPTQFVLVPSLRDAFQDYVYPQPPFADRVSGGVEFGVGEFPHDKVRIIGRRKYEMLQTMLTISMVLPSACLLFPQIYSLELPRTSGRLQQVHCVSNPAIIKINEVTIGLTSHDVVFDLTSDEVSAGGGNRLMRLTEHLLLQQSFYPLYPPPANSVAQLDLRQMDRWRMPYTPDILITPSRVAHFAREVRGCLCINPGQLSKGPGGGSFAELTVHPMPEEELRQVPEGEPLLHKVSARTSVRVTRI
jgi:DNA polymerase alpha subunit B